MLSIRVSKRPKARTLLLAAAATAVGLALVPTGVTYALWSDAEVVSPGSITSGSMTLTTNKSALNEGAWSNLLPGESATESFEVTHTGTVAAFLSASLAGVAPVQEIGSHLTVHLRPLSEGELCKPGQPGGMDAVLSSTRAVLIGDMPADTTTTLCAEVRLSDDAPITVQGQTASFAINLTATQR